MEKWVLILVLMGAIGTLLSSYFRESLRQIQQQKLVASKLETHLMDYSHSLFDEPFKEYLFIGHMWEEKQVMHALESQSFHSIEEAKRGYKKKPTDLKTSLEAGKGALYESIVMHHKHYRNMSADLFSHTIEQITKERDNLKENISFISDQEAAILPWKFACSAIQTKSRLYTIVDKTLYVTVALRNMESLNLKHISNELYEAIENVIFFSKYFFPLLNHARITSKQYLLPATLKNMLLIIIHSNQNQVGNHEQGTTSRAPTA